MLNKKDNLIIFVLCLIVISLGILVIFKNSADIKIVKNTNISVDKNINKNTNANQNINKAVNKNTNQNVNTNQPTKKIIIDWVDVSDWNIYENEEYGYSIKYPKDWNVKETEYFEKDFGIWVKYISFSDNEYYLIFLLNKIDENFNMGRTGIGAGDFENVGVLNVEEIDIILKNLVYENKIKEIFFSGRNDLYNLAGHFSSIENTYDENFYFDKTKLNIAKNIIKSFKFIDIKK